MSDQGLEIAVQMHRFLWQRFAAALDGLSPEEIDWRPLPEANNINAIVRHLRIEAEWHVTRLVPRARLRAAQRFSAGNTFSISVLLQKLRRRVEACDGCS